jgi:hypothetical protein
MGFDKLVRTDERARALVPPSLSGLTRKTASPVELRAVPLPEPVFRRDRNISKQEPLEDLLVMSDDYGDKSGVGRDRKQVRYSLPARVPQRAATTQKNSETSASLHRALGSISAFSPRKIEFKEQISTPDPVRQYAGDQIRRGPHITQRTDDDHSPIRHQGPRAPNHDSTYSLSPSSRSPLTSSTISAPPPILGNVEPQRNAEPFLAYAINKEDDSKLLKSLPLSDLQRLAAGKPTAALATRMWTSDRSDTSDEPRRAETPESRHLMLRQQHEMMDRMSTAQTGFPSAERSPARAWNQQDRNLQTQRLQQPSTASYSREHSSFARLPQSPEFSIR